MARVIVPVAERDFDPSEVALSWQQLRAAGHDVRFATASGAPGQADPRMISGEGLDPWGWIPGLRKLRVIGLMLRADARARAAYAALLQDAAFVQPLRFADLAVQDFDGLLLPGGHAKGMLPYLEDATLQGFVADFFDAGKPVAAVCHGVLLAARSVSKATGRSVLYGRQTTALTWQLERSAWHLTKYLARFWDPGYYRTYAEAPGDPVGYMSVEQEVKRALAADSDFLDVPKDAPHHWHKASGMVRDAPDDARPAWVVRDGNYLSARWPGDVHTLARQFAAMLAHT
ncbi:MAG: type 1 glutamine amidotransferase domain-containing protein [Pseudomonadota bacterium]